MPDSGEFFLRAGDEDAGMRLDRFVSKHLTGLSRSFVAGLIKNRTVLVAGKARKPGYRIRSGDEIRGTVPPLEQSQLEPEPISLDIIYEDAHIAVINKGAGMVIHPAPGHKTGTLVHAMLYHFPGIAERGHCERPGIVHRLDKDTSGLLVVAKTVPAQNRLSEQFKARRVKKTYLALVYGNPEEDAGEIKLPIGRHPVYRKKMSVISRSARYAETGWRVAERFSGASLLELDLLTGRTHQIRVHCAAVNMPIIGDPLYCSRSIKRRLEKSIHDAAEDVSRQMLHAWKLSIDHPESGKRLSFTAPVPDDMSGLMKKLRKISGLKIRSGEPSG